MRRLNRPHVADDSALSDLYREYQEAVAPFIRAKVEIYNILMPEIRFDADGKVTCEYRPSLEQQRTLDRLDQCIQATADKIQKRFWEVTPPNYARP